MGIATHRVNVRCGRKQGVPGESALFTLSFSNIFCSRTFYNRSCRYIGTFAVTILKSRFLHSLNCLHSLMREVITSLNGGYRASWERLISGKALNDSSHRISEIRSENCTHDLTGLKAPLKTLLGTCSSHTFEKNRMKDIEFSSVCFLAALITSEFTVRYCEMHNEFTPSFIVLHPG